MTPDEYLALERASDQKSEYWNGEMFAMAGASRDHVVITTNLTRALGNALEGRPCTVFANDLRLRVTATGLYTYPDVLVTCGEELFADDQEDTLLNPVLVVEVLSPSTEDWDRGKKVFHYRALESVRQIVLVAQDRAAVESFTRQGESTWLLESFSGLEAALPFPCLGLEVPLRALYERVDLESTAPRAGDPSPGLLRP